MKTINWQRMIALLDQYSIKPLIGIIPDCKSEEIQFGMDRHFWEMVTKWQQSGYALALHGYDHVYVTKESGINPTHKRSEFAGLSLADQAQKLKDGYTILKNHGVEPCCFFAPSHTYDTNTLLALKQETPIRTISDTFACYPYYQNDIRFVPCQMGVFRPWTPGGICCACYHPSIMNDAEFDRLEQFLKDHSTEFITFDQALQHTRKRRTLFERALQQAYYIHLKTRGLE
jgi:hypothetical protein